MSFVKIWIHAVWTTKDRERLLDQKFRPITFDHIHQNALKKEIYMDSMNGHSEHIHFPFLL
jgi:REP-associated tyrosine transposase